MRKEEFEIAVRELLTPTELALLNFCIYFNKKHIDYYEAYRSGKYDKCLTYLKEHRGELKLRKVPRRLRKQARQSIASAKLIATLY